MKRLTRIARCIASFIAVVALVVGGLTIAPTLAVAQKAAPSDTTIKYQKRTLINIGSHNIFGEVSTPSVSFITRRKAGVFAKNLRVRSSFSPELLHSHDEI